MPLQNNENHEIHKILLQNQETYKIELVHARIMKIMKFLKCNAKHLKKLKKIIIPLYNYEYHEIHRILHHKYENKKKHISCQNN